MRYWPAVIENHTFVPALFGVSPIVVDFGLNHGSFARNMIERFNARVFGAEPSSDLYNALPRHRSLQTRKVAIGGADGVGELALHTEICASLYSKAGDVRSGVESVVVWSLASFLRDFAIDQIDLMKVDIEGAECDMFETASADDLRRCKQITVEFHDFMIPELAPRVDKIKSRLEAAGFYRINFSLNNGDVLFIRRDVVRSLFVGFLNGPYKYVMGGLRRVRYMSVGK